jgi:hypothetical protein
MDDSNATGLAAESTPAEGRNRKYTKRPKYDPSQEELRREFAAMPDDNYCSDRYAAAYLGTSRAVLANLRSKKRGPPFLRMGARFVRYSVGGLRKHMMDHVVTTAD